MSEGAHAECHCPALLVAAPASGQGKTTVTAAIARRFDAAADALVWHGGNPPPVAFAPAGLPTVPPLLRGHSDHHSRMESPLQPLLRACCPNGGPNAEAVYRRGRLTASYVHFWFPSNPEAAARLFLP